MILISLLGVVGLLFQLDTAEPSPMGVKKTTLCELAKHPDQFAGHFVSVRAWVGGRKDVSLLDTNPSRDCPPLVVILELPKHIKPPAPFYLEEDDTYKRYTQALKQRTHIEATFEGRFDYVPRKSSFGYKGRANMRIVLHRITDLDVRPTVRLDR
jgi:hypothetical protein